MHKITETKRLKLREFLVSDSEFLYTLNSDPDVMKYTGDRAFSSILEAESFLRNYSDYSENGFGRWAVIHKGSGKFLGWCGLKLNEEKLVDLGFRFFRKEWGKGYATESAQACLDLGFNELNLTEIIGRAAIANKPSIRVLEKLGMQFWKHHSCKGIENSVYYRINSKQYKRRDTASKS